MKGATVAEILSERDALPGNAEDWSAFVRFPRGAGVVKDMLRSLAHVPYCAFPPKAHGILGDILLTKRKLHAWMIFKGYELPTFLCDLPPPTDSEHLERADESPAKPPRARPRKSGWRRLEQLVRERHCRESGDAARHAGIRCPQTSGDGISPAGPTVLGNRPPPHEGDLGRASGALASPTGGAPCACIVCTR